MNPEFKWWGWIQTGNIKSMKYKFVAFSWEVELLFFQSFICLLFFFFIKLQMRVLGESWRIGKFEGFKKEERYEVVELEHGRVHCLNLTLRLSLQDFPKYCS